jgi:hypothetical protein
MDGRTDCLIDVGGQWLTKKKKKESLIVDAMQDDKRKQGYFLLAEESCSQEVSAPGGMCRCRRVW